MHTGTGKIQVIQLEPNGERSARIECPPAMIPTPGKYLLAHNLQAEPVEIPAEQDSVLGWPLFPVGARQPLTGTETPLLGPIPPTWGPGTTLNLRGPLGHGFLLPRNIRRLALAAIGETASRLLPLIGPALESGTDIAIFTSAPLPPLPPALEIHPLSALPENLPWADFLVIDIPLELLSTLRKSLDFSPHDRLPCLAQALIWTPMPCGALADCGACAVPARRDYKLACKDGPVFDLREVEW